MTNITFDRRWSIARDGFGLESDNHKGAYVFIDDAIAVLHDSLAEKDARIAQLEAALKVAKDALGNIPYSFIAANNALDVIHKAMTGEL